MVSERDGASTSDPSSVPVKRRSILRGLGAAGLTSGLAGCSGITRRQYEAKPVEVEGSRLQFLGYDPTPTQETITFTEQRSIGDIGSIDVDITGHLRQWEYPTLYSEAQSTPEEETTRRSDPTGDDDIGARQLPVCDIDPALVIPSDQGSGTDADFTTDRPVDIADALVLRTIPDPTLAGVRLNPLARTSIEDFIVEHTNKFERVCDCDLGDPEQIDVQTATPGDTLAPDDIDSVVYVLDGLDGFGLPETVSVFGEETPIRYFAFATTTADGNVRAYFLVTAKSHYQTTDGQRDSILIAYVARLQYASLGGPRQLVDDDGLFSKDRVAAYLDRLAFGCPCLFETPTASPEGTDQENETPTPPTPPEGEEIDAEMVGPQELSSEETLQLWQTAKDTAETREVTAVAAENFGLELDSDTIEGYRLLKEGPGAYVLQGVMTSDDWDGLPTPTFMAAYDEQRNFRRAGIAIDRRIDGDIVEILSFAPVGESRTDYRVTIRKGRIIQFERRTAPETTELSLEGPMGGRTNAASTLTAVDASQVVRPLVDQRTEALEVRSVNIDWEDILTTLRCGACFVGMWKVKQVIAGEAGCYWKTYSWISSWYGGLANNPLGAAIGWTVARTFCNQIVGKSLEWALGASDCCVCEEIGFCTVSDCETLLEEGLIGECGCCSCGDGDDGTTGGGGGGGGSGGGGGGSGGGGTGGGGTGGGGVGNWC